MTAKLYDDVQSKLTKMWGPWAGWTQTALFTSDLKSFSEYGLITPSPSPEHTKPKSSMLNRTVSTGKLEVPESPTKKRKRQPAITVPKSLDEAKTEIVTQALSGVAMADPVLKDSNTAVEGESEGSLVDRIKRRKRVTLSRRITN